MISRDLGRAALGSIAAIALLAAAAALAEPLAQFELTLQNGKLVGGPALLKVRQGTRVELIWSSDKVAEIHLHGYNLFLHLQPGQSSLMSIEAKATGRFSITLHEKSPSGGHGHGALTYLEVHPD